MTEVVMTAAEQLAAAFPQGAIVENHDSENKADPSDPPTHHCAGLYVIRDNIVLFLDSSVGNDYTARVTGFEVQQETPVLLVKATTEDGYWLVRAETNPAQIAYNVMLRANQVPGIS